MGSKPSEIKAIGSSGGRFMGSNPTEIKVIGSSGGGLWVQTPLK
jgi:hypothetical protein